jgi:hypothetical protein
MPNKFSEGIFSIKEINDKNITDWYTNFLEKRYL